MDPTPASPVEAALFRTDSPASDAVVLEQYKLYAQLLDRISDRRQNANSFFLSINTGVGALIGYFFSKGALDAASPIALFIPCIGLLVSFNWHRLVISYNNVNAAKFTVLTAMEKRLPLAPYSAEWAALTDAGKQYAPITHVELWVTRSFMLLYSALLVYVALNYLRSFS